MRSRSLEPEYSFGNPDIASGRTAFPSAGNRLPTIGQSPKAIAGNEGTPVASARCGRPDKDIAGENRRQRPGWDVKNPMNQTDGFRHQPEFAGPFRAMTAMMLDP